MTDLREICEFKQRGGADEADRLLEEFYGEFGRLAEQPGLGHRRDDLTHRNVLFRLLRSYLIIYRETRTLRVIRILHAKRNVKKILDR